MKAAVLACVLSGCTIIGGVQGYQSANSRNAERAQAIQRGDKNPPETASVSARVLGYGIIGFAIDAVLAGLVVKVIASNAS